MATANEETVDFQLFRYYPNLAAAIVFVLLFAAITVVHIWQLVRTRTWLWTVFAVGGLC